MHTFSKDCDSRMSASAAVAAVSIRLSKVFMNRVGSGSGSKEAQWQIPFDARESIGWAQPTTPEESRTAEVNMDRSDSASFFSVRRRRRVEDPTARLETSCTRTGRPRRHLTPVRQQVGERRLRPHGSHARRHVVEVVIGNPYSSMHVQPEFIFRCFPDDLVHTWSFLASIFRHSSNGENLAAVRVGQQTL